LRRLTLSFDQNQPSNNQNAPAHRLENHYIGVAICLLLGPTNLILGLLFATGVYGSYSLPIAFYFFFFTLLDGTSLLATILLTMLMSRKVCMIKMPGQTTSVKLVDLVLILITGLLLIGGDVVAGVFVINGIDDAVGTAAFTSGLLAIFTFGNICTGLYFWLQARELGTYLAEYIRLRRTTAVESSGANAGVPLHHHRVVWRAISVLITNGALLVGGTIPKICLAFELSHGIPRPGVFLALIFVYFIMRSRAQFWHLVAISPRKQMDISCSSVLGRILRCVWNCPRRLKTAPDQPSWGIMGSPSLDWPGGDARVRPDSGQIDEPERSPMAPPSIPNESSHQASGVSEWTELTTQV